MAAVDRRGGTARVAALLESKYRVPGRRPNAVARPRLAERVSVASRSALTVPSAPAGFGKTTLLTEWLATVALYPVTRRVSQTAALGFVTARVVEATLAVGVLSLLSVVTLREDLAGATGAEATSLVTTGQALVAIHDWTFLLGPGLIPASTRSAWATSCTGPGSCRASSRSSASSALPPRRSHRTIFGAWDQVSAAGAVGALPIAVWEFSLGVWLTVKGFKPTPLTADGGPSAPTH